MSEGKTAPPMELPGHKPGEALPDFANSEAPPLAYPSAATPADAAPADAAPVANSELLRAASPAIALWLSRRLTLIGLARRTGDERYKLVRIFAADIQINHVLPDSLLHVLLRRRMLLGLLRRTSASASRIVEQIIRYSLPAGERDLPPASLRSNKSKFDAARENILLVVHQTSRTGAPVLGWNIVRHLSKHYNVFTVTLGGGPLLQDFVALSVETHGPFGYNSTNTATIDLALRKLFNGHLFKYAIINSTESRLLLEPCAARGIPTVFLVHEFASYVYARDELRAAFDLASEIVFPARLVADSSLKIYPELSARPLRILPQGMSVLPEAGRTLATTLHPALQELAAARAAGAMVVLGAGTVEFRKGVDLFLITAMRVCRENDNFRFIWVGHGYKPDEDMAYSVYLREQLERAGLGERMIFLDQQPDLEPVYALTDMFMLASRLDPMPNVTIDAVHRGIPVICFDQASGMADVLKSDPLTAGCVVDYLDTAMAAEVILALGSDRVGLDRVAAATLQLAASVFDMTKYVDALDSLGTSAAAAVSAPETARLPAYSGDE